MAAVLISAPRHKDMIPLQQMEKKEDTAASITTKTATKRLFFLPHPMNTRKFYRNIQVVKTWGFTIAFGRSLTLLHSNPDEREAINLGRKDLVKQDEKNIKQICKLGNTIICDKNTYYFTLNYFSFLLLH